MPPVLRIAFHKITGERHALEIVRESGRREQVECETRSYLTHDLLHYAVEAEAGLQNGFWGRLAAGATLAEMNERTGGTAAKAMDPEMAAIEQIVGALSGTAKGRTAEQLVEGMRRFAAALQATLPAWLTGAFVAAVHERMRQLMGVWRATPFGGSLELSWLAGAVTSMENDLPKAEP